MMTDELRSALEAVVAADPDVADRDELAGMVAAARHIRSALDAFDVRCARRSRELAAAGRAEAPESMFGRAGGRSSKQSREIAERATIGDALPQFEEALGGGDVSAGHLDALAGARRRLDDAQRAEFDDHEQALLAAAANEGVDTFTRRCRDLARRVVANSHNGSDADELDAQRAASKIRQWIDKATGMCVTQAELDPVRHAQLWKAIDMATASLRAADGNAGTPWSQLQVNALLAVSRGAGRIGSQASTDAGVGSGASGGPEVASADGLGNADDGVDDRDGLDLLPAVAEATVLVDFATLVDGLHEHSICETDDGFSLPVSTVRRLCCDAEIIPAVMGEDGEVLELGRSKRTANRAQRRALRSMHRTCAHPDCTVGFSACRIHHVRWWWRDRGRTDIDNLLPLCEQHHHLVHEGGWGLSMTPDRVVTWTRPDGTTWWSGPSTDRTTSPRSLSTPARRRAPHPTVARRPFPSEVPSAPRRR